MNKDQPPKPPRASSSEVSGAVSSDSDSLLPGEMRRRKPPKEAVEAAFQRFENLGAGVDGAEPIAEAQVAGEICPACGQKNRPGNRFCSMCGSTLPSPSLRSDAGNSEAQAGSQHYHHHHHYHYFPGGEPGRRGAPNSRDEKPTALPVSGSKGEHYSRAETAVRRLSQDWVIACNTKHLEDILELYAVDAMVYRSNEPAVRSTSALREYFVAALEAGLGEIAMEPARVEISGDLGYEAGKFTALMPGVGGKRREERGKYVRVMAKDADGDWKISVDCWSSDLTLAQ